MASTADRSEADADRSEADADRPEADADRSEADTDRPEADADRSEADADRSEADADRSEADADRSEADAVRGGDDPPRLAALAYVGPDTAASLSDADVTVADVREKAVSYRQLVAAGVNPGVAGKLRREHSLHWALDDEPDLDRRSERVRGLRDAEREWVASAPSSDDGPAGRAADPTSTDAGGTDTESDTRAASTAARGDADAAADPTTTDATDDAVAAEAAWRERAHSPPVTEIPAIGDTAAGALEAAGVDTVRGLATVDPVHLSARIEYPVERVREWHAAASERID